MTFSTPIDDSVLEAAVHKVAPSPWNRYTKIIEGAQARASLAEREREEMAAELAEIKQQRAAIGYDEIEEELARSDFHHGPAFATLHEAYAVILEELDEVWDITRQKYKDRNGTALRKELIQVAAMAIKALRSMNNFTGGSV